MRLQEYENTKLTQKTKKMILKTVTITGADDSTDINQMVEISKKFPFVEWGILFSVSKQGNTPRYPSVEWIKKLLDIGFQNNMNFSAHLCGEYSRKAVAFKMGDGDGDEILDVIHNYSFMFNRFQLNFNATNLTPDFDTFQWDVCSQRTCIIQHNKSNKAFCDEIIKRGCKVHFLYDGSGGRGTLASTWNPKIEGYYTGYAGGLNPDNVVGELMKIELTNKSNEFFWIDVETGVRTDDKLDLNKVRSFLKPCLTYMVLTKIQSTFNSNKL